MWQGWFGEVCNLVACSWERCGVRNSIRTTYFLTFLPKFWGLSQPRSSCTPRTHIIYCLPARNSRSANNVINIRRRRIYERHTNKTGVHNKCYSQDLWYCISQLHFLYRTMAVGRSILIYPQIEEHEEVMEEVVENEVTADELEQYECEFDVQEVVQSSIWSTQSTKMRTKMKRKLGDDDDDGEGDKVINRNYSFSLFVSLSLSLLFVSIVSVWLIDSQHSFHIWFSYMKNWIGF